MHTRPASVAEYVSAMGVYATEGGESIQEIVMDKNHAKLRNDEFNLSHNQNVDQNLNEWTINLNESTAQELSTQLGWNDELARKVVEYRERNGRFGSWEELRNIPELASENIDRFRNSVEF